MKNLSEEIFSLLGELKLVLEEETRLLKRMDRGGLIALLPRKLFLVEQLEKMSIYLKDLKSSSHAIELKRIISEIKFLNDTNRIFTEEALSLWNDLLSAILPKHYRNDGKTETAPVPLKGVTLKVEA
ncbi:MAG: hypothetical protein N2260_06050 [Syntrophobacterales bacterium]|nr:hypothetical protein [Syntrophobacterales bacterium]